MKRDRWERQLQFDMQFAERHLLAEGEVSQIFVLHLQDSSRIAVPDERWSEENRDVLYDLLRTYVVAWKVVAVSHVGEAWAATIISPAGETLAQAERRATKQRVRDREDRREVIIATVIYYDEGGDRRLIQSHREIKRANGKPSGLGPVSRTDDTDTVVGNLVDVVPASEASPLDQAKAELAIAALEECDLGLQFLDPAASPPRRLQ